MQKDNMHFNLFKPDILRLEKVVGNEHYAFPRFQRDFVWSPTKMKSLVESVYQGIPINAVYLWKRIGIPTKDGVESTDETTLVIDGQQRLTTLRAILLGEPYMKGNRIYEIRLAFNPLNGTFSEVKRGTNPNPRHIGNIAHFYSDPDAEKTTFLKRNEQRLTPLEHETVIANLEKLEQMKNYPFVVYALSNEVDLEEAHNCFVLTNQGGTKVSPGDLCMAWLETYQPLLAEGLVYFGQRIRKGKKDRVLEASPELRRSKFYQALRAYNVEDSEDLLFRPKIDHIVEILFHLIRGGKTFKVDSIAQQLLQPAFTGKIGEKTESETGTRVEKAFLNIINSTNYTRFNQIIKSFPEINGTEMKYAYWLFLQCVDEGKRNEEIARLLQRWYLLQLMTHVKTSGSAAFSLWMKNFEENGGLEGYLQSLENELSVESWEKTLPERLTTSLQSISRKKVITAWTMTHVLSRETALFDATALVETLNGNKSEHHIYPQKVLRTKGIPQKEIDVIANIAITSTEMNSAMATKPLHIFIQLEKAEGRLPNAEQHLTEHCIPEESGRLEYKDFLTQRAALMARKFKNVYLALKD